MDNRWDSWAKLVRRYADGRPICNCGQAYYSQLDNTLWPKPDGSFPKYLGCANGCNANQSHARDHVAKRVVADLGIDD